MPRSLKVAPDYINKVKSALQRNGFPSQQALAREIGMARATINNFFNGKPVDHGNFVEICEKLGLDWQAIACLEDALLTEPGQPLNTPQEPLEPGNSVDIDALVQKVRQKAEPSIQEWCGTMRVLTMPEAINVRFSRTCYANRHGLLDSNLYPTWITQFCLLPIAQSIRFIVSNPYCDKISGA